ncbi:metabotropic glutamate receptor 1 [Nephila pilipes]|uniref:Metabotropic glutamate receptor 1 n=1 Tax=Nephila pilipes TaxID=299642 RepID=A0A8X6U1T5_NEPPI|nr:metabotropic glutamate receptor 1 [Nephila pilipes]
MAKYMKLCFYLLFIFLTVYITCCAAPAENKTTPEGSRERPLISGASKEVRVVAKASNAYQYDTSSEASFDEELNLHEKSKMHAYTYNNILEKKIIETDGDIILGGLLRIHDKDDRLMCGPLMSKESIQVVEALLYTIDYVNAQKEFLPGIKLGAYILDDCNRDSFSLDQAVDFIRGSNHIYEKSNDYCAVEYPVFRLPKVSGVISATSSTATAQVANLLQLFKIPHVSFSQTNPELKNKQVSENFLTTTPSDTSQMEAVLRMVLKFKCPNIAVLYEDYEFGVQSFFKLEELLHKNNICVTIRDRVLKDETDINGYYDRVVINMMESSKCIGFVVFGSENEIAATMRAVRRNNCTGNFLWISQNALIEPSLIFNTSDETMEGVVTLRPVTRPLTGFEEYFKSLKVKTNQRNPWFAEYWEQTFTCKLPETMLTPSNTFARKECSGDEVLSTVKGLEMDKELTFVSDSVLAFAYAIKAMHADLCGDVPGVCKAMKHLNGTTLLSYLKNVSFEGLGDDKFEFSMNGDGPTRFDIFQVGQVTRNKYSWLHVGSYDSVQVNTRCLHLCIGKKGHSELKFVCNPPCKKGQVKKYLRNSKCCWRCLNCTSSQIIRNKICVECPPGQEPNEDRNYCNIVLWKFLELEMFNHWSYTVIAFAITGILMLMIILMILVLYRDSQVVQNSGEGSNQEQQSTVETSVTLTEVEISEAISFTDDNESAHVTLANFSCYENNLKEK